VESLIGVGEWISPHRIENLVELLWAYDSQPERGLYRLVQPFRPYAALHTTPETHQPTENTEF